MKITKVMLRRAGMREGQAKRLMVQCGHHAEINEAWCVAHLEVDWDWAAVRLLPPAAWSSYLEATAPARRAHKEAMATAFGRIAETLP